MRNNVEGLIVLVGIGAFWLGYELYGGFEIQYGESAIDLGISCLIGVLLILSFLHGIMEIHRFGFIYVFH